MTQKLSPQKISKMMALYFDGYSQSQVAEKLKINQATVSLSVEKFSALAEQEGLEAAGKEYEIMNQVKALHSLAAELKATKLTFEEVNVGLKMVVVFQKCGVKQEDYQDLVQAYTKMKSEGYIDSAVKLNKLEKSMGMTPDEIIAKAAGASQQLKQTQAQLQSEKAKLNAVKEELVANEKQKKVASQDLAAHMKQLGVDMNRLDLVESLAMALKETGIPDKEIQHFVQRQQLLNKAGFALDIFTAILEKAKVATSHDGGKEMLKMMSEYDGLTYASKTLQIKVEGLSKQVAGLEEQAKLKGKIDGETAKLKAEKASLEAHVAGLHDLKDEFDQLKTEVGSLTEKKYILLNEISEMEKHKASLISDIAFKEQKVGNLEELESKYDELLKNLSEIQANEEHEQKRWGIFESFLGIVGSSSFAELEKFAAVLPDLLKEVKLGKYSPELLRRYILQQLAGPELQVLKCTSCQLRFHVDKPADPLIGYRCPKCGSSFEVKVDKEAMEILKAALPAPKSIIVLKTTISNLNQKQTGKKENHIPPPGS